MKFVFTTRKCQETIQRKLFICIFEKKNNNKNNKIKRKAEKNDMNKR